MNLHGLRIMVIDDSPTITRAAEAYLTDPPIGIVLEKAKDGLHALPTILKFKPDIILLDVTMPHSNGFEICSLIKRNRRTSHIKVIMVTSKDSIFDMATGRAAHADDYVPKPFKREVLMAALEKHVPDNFKTA